MESNQKNDRQNITWEDVASRIKQLELLKEDANKEIKDIKKKNPMCPLCSMRFPHTAYSFSLGTGLQGKPDVRIECPNGHNIGVGLVEDYGVETLDELKDKYSDKIEKMFRVLEDYDEGYAD